MTTSLQGGLNAVRLHPIFTDHMVLQRGKPVPVWGTGTDGLTVKVEAGGITAETVVDGGVWQVTLAPLAENAVPFELTVAWDGGELVLRDVVAGDVWLAGGQSNMEFKLAETVDAAEQTPLADYPLIRFFDVPNVAVDGAAADQALEAACWQTCTPLHVGEFSAVAYHFARCVHTATDVPIGIIGCNRGGTSASCWIEERRLADDAALRIYLDEFAESVGGLTEEEQDAKEQAYTAEIEAYNRAVAAGETREYPWPPPVTYHAFTRPNGLYRTMLSKVVPYALKGFIFYQGESDTKHPLLYDKLLTSLIDNWRTDWADDSLPFLFVQLPRYGNNNSDGEEYALLRESQQLVSERVAHTGMAVVLDCGERDDIHPADKRPVGERLALVAQRLVYGQPVESSGPTLRDWRVQESKAVLKFGHTGAGLRAEGAGNELIGFELAGEDERYWPATAEIEGDSVMLWSEHVPQPQHVRYGWKNYNEANLANSLGLAAAPFRTNRAGR